MSFSSSASEGTVIHELTHAYNDLRSTGIEQGGMNDEGMAYAVSNSLAPLNYLKIMEEYIKSSNNCKMTKALVKSYWLNYWDRYHKFSQWGDKTVVSELGSYFDKTEPLNRDDFRNVDHHLGANFSCSRIANALNEILISKNCCIRVACDPPAERRSRSGTGAVLIIGTKQFIEVEY